MQRPRLRRSRKRSSRLWALHKNTSWALIERPYSCASRIVGAVYDRPRFPVQSQMTSFPEWVVPMAATLTQERFTGPEWVFERKLDGIRLLAFKNGVDVKLYSRNRLPQNY